MRSGRAVGWISRIALVTVVLGASPILTRGSYSLDPKPPMRWDDLAACQLVVVARYHSHAEGVLTLGVERVLKGEATAGELITAHLEHRYSIETAPTGVVAGDKKPDGIPRLCYLWQPMTPGRLVPTPMVPDVREPAVYFFPDAARPALVLRGQVRFAVFADAWKRVVHGRPAGLEFRLMQVADPQRSWDALEELACTRDPAVIARLIEWVTGDPTPGRTEANDVFLTNGFTAADDLLARLGDANGDLYDPLIRWLRDDPDAVGPRTWNRVRKVYSVVILLGRLDADRAFADFLRLVREDGEGGRLRKETVLQHLGRVGGEKAVEPLLALLASPDWYDDAVIGLRGTPCKARLREALASAKVSEKAKEMIRKTFFRPWPPTPDVTVAEARRVLLAPGVPTHNGTEADRLLDEVRRAADPQFLPLLAQIIREVPGVREARCFERAARTYAQLFPDAFRAELGRRGVSLATGTTEDGKDVLTDEHLRVFLHVPPSMKQLAKIADSRLWPAWLEWTREHGLPAGLREKLAENIRRWLHEAHGPDTKYLTALLLAAPETGRPLLAAALEHRERYRTFRRADILALAVREGRKDLLDELIALERRIVPGGDLDAHGIADSLLLCEHPRAKPVFLELLRGARKVHLGRFDNRAMLDTNYTMLLRMLGRYDEVAHVREALDLAASNRYFERWEAQQILGEFGYRAGMLAEERTRTLARIRPAVAELSRLDPLGLWVFWLRRNGVPLEGAPGKAWLPALIQAAARSAAGYDADADRALRLVEHITGQRGALAIIRFRPDRRPEILRRWLAHRGVTLPPSAPAESASAAAASETDPTHTD